MLGRKSDKEKIRKALLEILDAIDSMPDEKFSADKKSVTSTMKKLDSEEIDTEKFLKDAEKRAKRRWLSKEPEPDEQNLSQRMLARRLRMKKFEDWAYKGCPRGCAFCVTCQKKIIDILSIDEV